MICNNIPVKSIFAFLYKVSHFFCSLSYYQYLRSSIKSTELTQNRFIDTNIEKNQRHGINKNYLPKKLNLLSFFHYFLVISRADSAQSLNISQDFLVEIEAHLGQKWPRGKEIDFP